MGAAGKSVFPEWVFVFASMLRFTTVCVLCGLVVAEMLRPERDPVRQIYDDDPDGGVFDGAPPRSTGSVYQRPPVAVGTSS
jgi:hypothetical protein